VDAVVRQSVLSRNAPRLAFGGSASGRVGAFTRSQHGFAGCELLSCVTGQLGEDERSVRQLGAELVHVDDLADVHDAPVAASNNLELSH
jgi:hypothetical protein